MEDNLYQFINFSQVISDQGEKKLFDSLIITGLDDSYFATEYIPRMMHIGGLGICIEGSCEIMIDTRYYQLKKNDMCVIFPNHILQTKSKTPDFKCYTIGVESDFFTNFDIPSSTSLYLFIKENPCVTLSNEEVDNVLEICSLLKKKSNSNGLIYKQRILELILTEIGFEIASIYRKNKPLINGKNSRKGAIVQKFMLLLAEYYNKEREIKFYASQLCISPKYLYSVVKEETHRTPIEWVSYTVILNAKVMLKSSKYTVQQISEQLNFPNPSFFGKYFKKHVGMSPKRYKNQHEE